MIIAWLRVLLFFGDAKIVGAEEGHAGEEVKEKRGNGSQGAANRRSKSEAPETERATGEQLPDFLTADALDVFVSGIIEHEVVPDQAAVPAQDAEHLCGDGLLDLGVEHRSQH